MSYNKVQHTELQGKSPKMMMYIMVFSVPAITIIATDIAIYFKVKMWTSIHQLIFCPRWRRCSKRIKDLVWGRKTSEGRRKYDLGRSSRQKNMPLLRISSLPPLASPLWSSEHCFFLLSPPPLFFPYMGNVRRNSTYLLGRPPLILFCVLTSGPFQRFLMMLGAILLVFGITYIPGFLVKTVSTAYILNTLTFKAFCEILLGGSMLHPSNSSRCHICDQLGLSVDQPCHLHHCAKEVPGP